jgi:small subunit ribosomal protein S9
MKENKYFESVGRRKEATARARLYQLSLKQSEENDNNFCIVNGKPYNQYFPKGEFQSIAIEPIEKLKLLGQFQISAKIKGGGIKGQAEALRLAIARALLKFDPQLKSELKALNFLTRDPRMKERKKYGLKKARRAAQWSIR